MTPTTAGVPNPMMQIAPDMRNRVIFRENLWSSLHPQQIPQTGRLGRVLKVVDKNVRVPLEAESGAGRADSQNLAC